MAITITDGVRILTHHDFMYEGDLTLLDDLHAHANGGFVLLSTTGPSATALLFTDHGLAACAVLAGLQFDADFMDVPPGATDGPDFYLDTVAKHYGPGAHPGTGTSQSIHGRISALTVEGIDNTMASLPDKTRATIEAKAKLQLGTRAKVLSRLRSLMEDAAERPEALEWQFWYEDGHEWATEIADKLDLSVEEVAGATAAMSSGMEWEKNKRMAELLGTAISEDPLITSFTEDVALLQAKLDKYAEKYDLDPVVISEGARFSDIEDSRLAAVSFQTLSSAQGDAYPARYGYGTLAQAIEIMRGGHPGDVITGMKRRSFYNNLLGLADDSDVTIDVQMLSAARGKVITEQESALQTSLVNSPSITRQGTKDGLGVRPWVSDIVRDLTVEFNERTDDPWDKLLPRHTQAIIWSEWKAQYGRWGEER